MKRVIISFLIVGVITSLGIIGSNYFNKDEKLNSNETLISYYVETGEGTGVYEKQEGTTWPEGYVLNEEKSTCDNGSTLSWDDANNAVIVTSGQSDDCKIYFDKEQTGAEYIESLLTSNPETMNNDDPDGNVRYIGSNPNNYVWFNDELWQIIGVFDIKSDENKDVEKRIKLIRDESIGMYSWDSSESSINGGKGVNEWSQADLMYLLNEGSYWNRTTGICYNGQNNSTTSCDFSSNGLTPNAKKLIENAVWNTGTFDTDFQNIRETASANKFYLSERSNKNVVLCSNSELCNDTVVRTTAWVGQVGLIYPSDYGFATSGGNTSSRELCLNTGLWNWHVSDYDDCGVNNWLTKNNHYWTLVADPEISKPNLVLCIYYKNEIYISHVTADYVSSNLNIYPSVYLKSSIKITSGDGTNTNPYQLSL